MRALSKRVRIRSYGAPSEDVKASRSRESFRASCDIRPAFMGLKGRGKGPRTRPSVTTGPNQTVTGRL